MFRQITSSIRNKLILVVLATNMVALLVVGLILVLFERGSYREDLHNELKVQGEIIGFASAAALQFDDPASADAYLALLRAHPSVAAAAIYTGDGKIFASLRKDDMPKEFLPSDSEGNEYVVKDKSMRVFTRISEADENVGTVYLWAHYRWKQQLLEYVGILSTAMVSSILVVLVVASALQARLTGPILAVSGVARRVVADRDYSLRAEKTSTDEIGILVDAFNEMLAEIGLRSDATQRAVDALEHQVQERLKIEEAVLKLNSELEQRVIERTVQLEQTNGELESFSYSVSHDLRAPLRAITGFANLLVRDHGPSLGSEAQRKLKIIQSESLRMGTLIDDLLAFSRLGRKVLVVRSLNMTAMARKAFDRCMNDQSVGSCELQLFDLPEAVGDPVLIGQVWENLLSNALKFSAKRNHPLIVIKAFVNERETIYSVRDNGAGYDPRYQNKLFEVFQRLHDSSEFAGTGVGLAIVQRIIDRHAGRVWALSQPDEGATFHFALPRGPIYE